MPTKLTAHEQSIYRIFSNEYVFRIPPYQRPYAWTPEQARDLIDDLLGFMRTQPGAVDEMPPYFLGSIVLIKPEDLANADVVDGQQRLTTLTLLLSAIRANVDPHSATDITQLIYEKGSQIRGTQDRFRLSLRERDKEFFQRYCQREGGFAELLALPDSLSDSQRNLRDNARLFDARLKTLAEKERVDLAQFVVTRCFLVTVATPDLDSAYRIFSVLNSRGLDLSATDREPGLSDACGCYLFALRAGKGFTPYYVGQACKRSIFREALNPANLVKYNTLDSAGTPVLFLIPMKTPQDKFRKPSQAAGGLAALDFLERWLIAVAMDKNVDLLNNRETKFLRNIHVRGIFNSRKGEWTLASQDLRRTLWR